MTTSTCLGVGKLPLAIRVQPAKGVRGIQHGRGVCPNCRRTLALNKNGVMVNHKPGIAATR